MLQKGGAAMSALWYDRDKGRKIYTSLIMKT